MPKRKHDETLVPNTSSNSPSTPSDRVLARQKKLCIARLETTQKDLLSALRFSAGFERQKYSRRKKTAKSASDDKATARIDAEYAILKGLDFPKVAEQHLRKTIARVTSIKDSKALPEEVRVIDRVEGAQDVVRLNVLARLYNGAGVKKVVDRVVGDLKEILGVGDVGGKAGKEKERKKAKTEAEKEVIEDVDVDLGDVSDDNGEAFSAFNARIAAPSSVEGESDDSLTEGHRPPSIDDSETDSEADSEDDSDDIAIDVALGSLSKSDDNSSSEAIHSAAVDSVTLDSASSESEPEPVPEVKIKAKAKAAKEPICKSTFLPSLSHAAYYSGSESEASDLDIDLAPRKNRRGQKARQKIWEKKYGEKAKHKEKEDRNQGWDAKKGAVGEKRGRGRGRVPEVSGENAQPLGEVRKVEKEKKRDDVGVLHPSWLAAKAAKEKKVAVKPQGKKIVFD